MVHGRVLSTLIRVQEEENLYVLLVYGQQKESGLKKVCLLQSLAYIVAL